MHRRAVEKEWYKISFRDENGRRGGGGKMVECGTEIWGAVGSVVERVMDTKDWL